MRKNNIIICSERKVVDNFVTIGITIIGESNPDHVSRVVLGVSAGSILGLSISTQIGVTYGYPFVNAWIFLINVEALIGIYLLFPKMDGPPTDSIKNFSFTGKNIL